MRYTLAHLDRIETQWVKRFKSPIASRVLLVPASNPVIGNARALTGAMLTPLPPYPTDSTKPLAGALASGNGIGDGEKARVMVVAVWASDDEWENQAAAYMARLTDQHGSADRERAHVAAKSKREPMNVGTQQQSQPVEWESDIEPPKPDDYESPWN